MVEHLFNALAQQHPDVVIALVTIPELVQHAEETVDAARQAVQAQAASEGTPDVPLA